MTLMRAYARVDEDNKISLPANIVRQLKLTPGQLLELKVQGMNKAPYLLLHKRKAMR